MFHEGTEYKVVRVANRWINAVEKMKGASTNGSQKHAALGIGLPKPRLLVGTRTAVTFRTGVKKSRRLLADGQTTPVPTTHAPSLNPPY